MKKDLNKAECPEFDYFNYEPILEWSGAKVKYSDTFVHMKTGEARKNEKEAHWTLLWSYGFIGFDSIRGAEDEAKARMAGAMFIYLWCKGVSASIADNCASLYARNVIMYECQNE